MINSPNIKLYLDNVDSILNSNTFLLCADNYLTSLDQKGIFTFLQSQRFTDLFFKCDFDRQWHNFYDIDLSSNEVDSEGGFYKRRKGNLLSIDSLSDISITNINENEFYKKLIWLLTDAYSPYKISINFSEAKVLVDNFLTELSFEKGFMEAIICKPNFLHSVEYYKADDDFEPHPLAYFGGDDTDLALFFRIKEKSYILLTNGYP